MGEGGYTMSMTRPEGWHGSDLRSRTEVVRYLAERGGVIEDPTGLLVGTMRQELGKGRALTQLLADMEADGMLRRTVKGRRTMKIELLDDWGLVPRLASVPDAVASSEDGAALPVGTDLTQLAEALLAITIKRATASAAPAPKSDGALSDRLRRAETALSAASEQLTIIAAERDEARGRVVELEDQVRILENNVEVYRRQAAAVPVRNGPTIEERLSSEERALLAELQTALPETPGSKPRSTPRKRTR